MNRRKAVFRSDSCSVLNSCESNVSESSQLVENFFRNKTFQQQHFTAKLYSVYVSHLSVKSRKPKRYVSDYVREDDACNVPISETLHMQNALGNLHNIYSIFSPKKGSLVNFIMQIALQQNKENNLFVYLNEVYYEHSFNTGAVVRFVNLYDMIETIIDFHCGSIYGKMNSTSQIGIGDTEIERLMLHFKKVSDYAVFVADKTNLVTEPRFQCGECGPEVISALEEFYTKKIETSFPDAMFTHNTQDMYIDFSCWSHAFMLYDYMVFDFSITVSYHKSSFKKDGMDIERLHCIWERAIENITGEVCKAPKVNVPENTDSVLCVLGFLVVLTQVRKNMRTLV